MEEAFSKHITRKKFTRFVVPSVIMELVLGVYYLIDTLFVSIFVGKNALATISIAYPVIGIMWGFSVMLACGSSALVAIDMGAGRNRLANRRFSTVCIVALSLSAILITCTYGFLHPICQFLGASGELSTLCKDYMQILIWAFPAAFIQVIFEYYIRVDGHPGVTLVLSLISGAVHMIVDFVLMGLLDFGIQGAAWGTVCGVWIAAAIGTIYFIKRSTNLKLQKPIADWKFIGHTFANGSSEFVNEASEGINTYFFNQIMLHLAGSTGVAALSIAFSIHFVVACIHMGFTVGVEPLISYFFGAGRYDIVNRVLHYTKEFLLYSAVIISVAFFFAAPIMARPFATPGTELYAMAVTGMRLLAPSFLVCGLTIFGGGFFTAYGNGGISASISSSRTLVTAIAFAFALSYFFGTTGLWLSTFAAEAVTAIMTIALMKRYKDRYHYSFIH